MAKITQVVPTPKHSENPSFSPPPGWTAQKASPSEPLVDLQNLKSKQNTLKTTAKGKVDPRLRAGRRVVYEDDEESTDEDDGSYRNRDSAEAQEDGEIPLAVWIFQAAFITIPMTMMYAVLEYMVYKQFLMDSEIVWSDYTLKILKIIPALSIFIFITNKHQKSLVVEVLFFLICILCGGAIIYIHSKDGTFGGMSRTPGLSVLWVYSVMQMNKWSALATCVFVYSYYYFDAFNWENPMRSLDFGKGEL